MTSIDTWPLWTAIIFTGGPILLAASGLAFSLYLTHNHLDAMKEALKNSRYIYLWGPSLGRRGLIWSLLEMGKIAGMITTPTAYIQLGDLDPVDLANFPPYLKRLLIVNTTLILTSLVWLVAVVILLKLK